MKTTVNHSHKNSVINYLFFGIAASIFTLSIFFSYFQQEQANLSKDLSYMVNSRLTKPVSVAPITETYAVNLKEMITQAEAPMTIESWMTEPYEVSAQSAVASSAVGAKAYALPTTFTENAIVVEEWMTDVNSWNLIASNTFEEEALALESWMLNTEEWAVLGENSAFASDEFASEQLYIESWMLDLTSWSSVFNDTNFEEAPLAIENWMLNTDDWITAK